MVEQVSSLTITGIIFSMTLSIGGPVAVLLLTKRKLHTKMADAAIGAGTFVLFALVLEQALHMVVLDAAEDIFSENLWLYALYGGLAAGVFEETGRYLAMKYCMKKRLSKESALMYGIGHGGIEAILLVGFSSISNLITVIMINNGEIESAFSVLDAAAKEEALQGLSVLWTTPGYQFFLAGVERISAFVLHICLSYLVYRAVKYGRRRYYLGAVGIHFLIDAMTLFLANSISLVLLEAVLLGAVGVLAMVVRKMYRAENDPASGERALRMPGNGPAES